jgi:hypothetical protein
MDNNAPDLDMRVHAYHITTYSRNFERGISHLGELKDTKKRMLLHRSKTMFAKPLKGQCNGDDLGKGQWGS